MAHSKYYSPRLDRDLIARLFQQARTERIPMTALASRLIRAGLTEQSDATTVAEEPPAAPLPG